jgi:hypothetical protein
VPTTTVDGINILEFDRLLNAAVDVTTFIAQNYKENEEFCDSFSSTFKHVAPSILYMCNAQLMLKTQSISVCTCLVHPPSKFRCSVYHYGYLMVPEILNVPIFSNYDNHKNSLTDFWRENVSCLKQVFFVVPI